VTLSWNLGNCRGEIAGEKCEEVYLGDIFLGLIFHGENVRGCSEGNVRVFVRGNFPNRSDFARVNFLG